MKLFGTGLSREVTLYLLVGVANTLLGYAVYATGIWLGLHFAWAALVSQIIGAVFNYFSYGFVVFRQRPKKVTFGRFLVQYAFLYGLTLLILTALSSLGLNAYLAGAVNIVVVPIVAFFSNKFFVFRKERRQP